MHSNSTPYTERPQQSMPDQLRGGGFIQGGFVGGAQMSQAPDVGRSSPLNEELDRLSAAINNVGYEASQLGGILSPLCVARVNSTNSGVDKQRLQQVEPNPSLLRERLMQLRLQLEEITTNLSITRASLEV